MPSPLGPPEAALVGVVNADISLLGHHVCGLVREVCRENREGSHYEFGVVLQGLQAVSRCSNAWTRNQC